MIETNESRHESFPTTEDFHNYVLQVQEAINTSEQDMRIKLVEAREAADHFDDICSAMYMGQTVVCWGTYREPVIDQQTGERTGKAWKTGIVEGVAEGFTFKHEMLRQSEENEPVPGLERIEFGHQIRIGEWSYEDELGIVGGIHCVFAPVDTNRLIPMSDLKSYDAELAAGDIAVNDPHARMLMDIAQDRNNIDLSALDDFFQETAKSETGQQLVDSYLTYFNRMSDIIMTPLEVTAEYAYMPQNTEQVSIMHFGNRKVRGTSLGFCMAPSVIFDPQDPRKAELGEHELHLAVDSILPRQVKPLYLVPVKAIEQYEFIDPETHAT